MTVLALLQEAVPDAMSFPHWGWWVLHAIAIPTVFFVGFLLGKKQGRRSG